MKIGIISLVSELRVARAAKEAAKPLMCELRGMFSARELDIKNFSPEDIPVVLIKSGGAEHKFREIAPALIAMGKPTAIMAEGGHNSLSAALEIIAWCRRNGMNQFQLIHGSKETMCAGLKQWLDSMEILQAVADSRIGVVGSPSDWLIGSEVDFEQVRRRWGATFIDIDIQQLVENIRRLNADDVLAALPAFPPARFMEDVGPREIGDSVKTYLALRKIIADYHLNVITVRCFDLINLQRGTACLALARLNDEGIPAGCEGDIPGAFTMLLSRLISGEPSFMANPWRIVENRVSLCHCSAPLSMTKSFSFKTQFESGKGLAVAGKFEKGPITLSRIGGVGLEQFYADDGYLKSNTQEPEACRTQILVELAGGTDYFFSNPLGNHHIVTRGHWRQRFREIMDLANRR